MGEAANRTVEYFNTYETREEAFRERVNALIPRKYGGPSLFWTDFRKISFDRPPTANGGHHAYITSNPRDCLAYATPRQVLSAGLMQARAADGQCPASVEAVAECFNISQILGQPIRSLSGGETVKLSLAKSFVAAAYSRRLTISSPFSWLSASNSACFDTLFDRYQSLGIPVDILALDGEDTHNGIDGRDPFLDIRGQDVAFDLKFEGVRISLGTLLNDLYGHTAQAAIANFGSRLRSPCLLVGENGQGKSLVAKALAGAIAHKGIARIGNGAAKNRVRLLFQDVVTQTLLRSFESLAASSFPKGALSSSEIYARIIRHITTAFSARGMAVPPLNAPGPRTLLEIKAMLIAARLASPLDALILDEPDWGLTRAASTALVSAAIDAAHATGTPVILISHKPWWRTVAASSLEVERSDAGPNGSFEIFVANRGGTPS